jgi:hypothetical protein
MNLKKMQSIARRRLGLTGEVEFVQRDGPDGRVLAASAPKATLEMKHVVVYSKADSLDPADVYHEMCRAKLYELGFKTVENAALVALKDCAGEDPKYIFDANSSIVIVSEVYSSYLLYTYFSEESDRRREEIVLRFESSDALTSLHTQMGFWGVAGIAYYRIASEWADKEFPLKQIEAAISRAPDGQMIREELEKIEKAMQELPEIENPIREFSDSEQFQILSAVSELFTAKTGIECS